MTTDLQTTPSNPATTDTARRTLLRVFREGIPERVAGLVEDFCCEDDNRLLDSLQRIRIETNRHGFPEIAPLVAALTADLEVHADRSSIADRLDTLIAALRELRG